MRPARRQVHARTMPPGAPHPSDTGTPRVAIVDADRRVHQSVSDLLRLSGGIEVVGESGDVRGALALMEEQRPDVVLLDPRLPDLEAGRALMSSIALGWPDTRIVLSGWSDPREEPDLMAVASAYVDKAAPPEEFVAAIMNACGCG